MNPTTIGDTTYITRVETWECDYNGHWNTRFYTRAFQCASEAVALLDGRGHNPGAATINARHIRFHRELLAGDPVSVRSAAVRGGRWDGAIVHWLESEGRLSAAALEQPGLGAEHLPQVAEADLALALPKGLVHEPPLHLAGRNDGRRANLGILRPSDFDHTGALVFDNLFLQATYASYDHQVSLGFSPSFMSESGVGRMVVEMRATWLGQAPAGAALRAHSWLLHAHEKSFALAHLLQTHQGDPIALIELCLVAVNMQTRRATRVPDTVLAQAGLSGKHLLP